MQHKRKRTGLLAKRAGAGVCTTAMVAYDAARQRIPLLCGTIAILAFSAIANARTVLAGEGATDGDPGAVEGALEAAVDWISGIVVTAGVLGLIAAAIVWIFSGSNERRREKATGWVVGCVLAIAVAFLAPGIVALMQEWTGGGQ